MKDEMDPFQVEFIKDRNRQTALIKPCCKEDNIFYYDVWMNDEFQFSMTTNSELPSPQQGDWNVALMNADKQVDPELVQALGSAIEFHYAM